MVLDSIEVFQPELQEDVDNLLVSDASQNESAE